VYRWIEGKPAGGSSVLLGKNVQNECDLGLLESITHPPTLYSSFGEP
jgi:hypothetical protein